MSERLRRDEGQVLALALVFLIFVALVLAATLTAAASSLRATQVATQQRDERYAAEAGILAAAGGMQNDQALGTDPQPSPDQCGIPPGSDIVVNSMQVVVSCTALPGSGTGPGAANRPPYSVLALTSSGDGSNEGVIPVNVPNLKVFGPVGSRGTCYPPPDLPGMPSCEKGPIPDPGAGGTDSGYAPRAPNPPPAAPAPTCNAGVATFSSGTYNAPPTVTGCDTWWFQPGPYYFDFTNDGPHVWTIDSNTTVVGGIPNQGRWIPGQPPTLPGACRTDQDLAATDGVQFIFGGDSRMRVGPTGAVELCAQPSTSKQQIAIYGMTPTLAPPQQSFLHQSPSTTAVTNSAPPFVPYDSPDMGTVIGDESEAQASIPANGAGSLQVASGFQALPAGSIVDFAQVNVVHHEDPAIQTTVDVHDGTTQIGFAPPSPNPACSTGCTTTVDVTQALQNDPSLATRLNVTFTATAPGAGGPYSSFVDGFELFITAYVPTGAYRPLLGCTQRTLGTVGDPDGPQQPCPVVSTRPGASLYVHGTVYAPTGGLDVNGQPNDPVRFNRGIIARTVVFRPGNGGSEDFVTAGGSFNRYVVLEARVNGNLRVVTSVSFDDVQAFLDQSPPKITYRNWDIK